MSDYGQEVEASRHLARSLKLPFVDLRRYRISPGILRKLSRDHAVKYRCVPMIYNRRRIVFVHENPADALYLSCDPATLGSCRSGPDGLRVFEFALTTGSAFVETLERRLSLPD